MIGAGSVVFSKKLTGDILSYPEFRDAVFAYMDIDADRLEVGAALCRKTARGLGANPTVVATTDRREALAGADFVINMVQIGGFNSTLVDFEIPRKYGLNFTIADTTGPGGLFRALRTFPLLRDAHIALMDINAERLDFAKTAVTKIITEGQYPATVSATLDRVEALRDADVVLTTILAGSTEVWKHDIEIPKKYGIDTNVGDTRGPSGVFRALRTIPVMLEICRDIEKYCPDALLLNYTNPMAPLCLALNQMTKIRIFGFCQSS